jgi:hypothetical protein
MILCKVGPIFVSVLTALIIDIIIIFQALFRNVSTIRDTEFRASVFWHFKKLRCKSLFIVNVTFRSQILKFIFYSRQSHVSQNRRKR